jgi:hypothetical protein
VVELTAAIDASVRYLASDAASDSLRADVYWPKWDSPWWHALLLVELGAAARVPTRGVLGLLDAIARFSVKSFPITDAEMAGLDPHRDVMCHCGLGSVARVLSACGVDVHRELPWIEAWFVRYQMADGGLNCDHTAYRASEDAGVCASSMVGTIAPLEAMLCGDPATWSAARRGFVDRAAAFVIGRRIVDGSASRHNAEERDAAASWRACCFPRFYFYDALRGASALLAWSRATGAPLPRDVLAPVVAELSAAHPDGVVRVARRPHDGLTTFRRGVTGWARAGAADEFPLLDAVSTLGAVAPPLTHALAELRAALA